MPDILPFAQWTVSSRYRPGGPLSSIDTSDPARAREHYAETIARLRHLPGAECVLLHDWRPVASWRRKVNPDA